MKTDPYDYEHKKYALLENGDVQPLYYSNGEERMIWWEEEDNCFSLSYDKFYRVDKDTCGHALCNSKILRESDNIEELKEDKRYKPFNQEKFNNHMKEIIEMLEKEK